MMQRIFHVRKNAYLLKPQNAFKVDERFFSNAKPSGEATRILNTYTDKIKSKARQEGVSVNQLINQSVPRDEVLQTRRVENQVASWRQNYHRNRGNTVFVSVPWLDKKSKQADSSNNGDASQSNHSESIKKQ